MSDSDTAGHGGHHSASAFETQETWRKGLATGSSGIVQRFQSLLPVRRRRPPRSFGRVGSLEVCLAESRDDIRQAQALRYSVFYEEMSAVPSPTARMRRRDEDPYDAICDHLLVIDHDAGAGTGKWQRNRRPAVVGTYRVLRQAQAERSLGFYTQGEYDIAPLISRLRDAYTFIELGRSCVLKPYRNKRTVELLWHGLWTYVREHKVDVMIGCASFPGVDPEAHAIPLSFMYHNVLAPEKWRCRAHDHLHVAMDILPKDRVDAREALKAMPPLIKGYLRLGAMVGDGAVIDRQFGTTDVLIVLPVENIDPRYFGHFGAPDEVKSRISRST
ncbi:MAG: GNAT family N-acetyltransferase [Alphaproteobacteria bacterium]|nr:GNAT family N-acetyltransferase [Alphaproteobacteria bacterium]